MSDFGLTLRAVLLPVTELDGPLHFYRDSFGLAVLLRDRNEYAELAAGGVKIALAAPADQPVRNTPVMMFRTTDVNAALSRLVEFGASVVTSPHAGEHETRAVLRDPGGNPFVVYQSRG